MSHTLSIASLKDYLDGLAAKYNCRDFIENDPISVPHGFSKKQDIEIAGFFSAILSWGNRKTIISKAKEILTLMDDAPHQFIVNHKEKERIKLLQFKHRTFQGIDLLYFIEFLQTYYNKNDSLEHAFYPENSGRYNQKMALSHFYDTIFGNDNVPARTKKHIGAPHKNSTCKRLNMYLRWMVRKDDRNVDFGIWKSIPTSELMIPLDVHVEKYARHFGLLTRRTLDWTAVEEITSHLKAMRPDDPVYYDYALFSLGAMKQDQVIISRIPHHK